MRVLLLLALHVGAVCTALVCEQTGQAAPEVLTLMASKTNPATEAWFVQPDCDIAAQYAPLSDRSDVERVDSIPSSVDTIYLPSAPLSRGADFSKAMNLRSLTIKQWVGVSLPSALTELTLSGSSLSAIGANELPPALVALDLSSTQLKSLQGVKLPNTLEILSVAKTKLSAVDFALPLKLRYIDLSSTPLKSLKGVVFPASLQALYLQNSQLSAIEFTIPSQLDTLNCDFCPLSKIERITFPEAMLFISFKSCGLTTVRGVKFPRRLSTMNLDGNPIVNFEIRRSDLAILQKTTKFTGEIVQSRCADSTAQIVVVAGKQLCVISDARFEAVYVNGNGVTPDAPLTPAAPTTGQEAGSAPGESTTEGSKLKDSSGSSLTSESSSSNADPARPARRGNSTAPGAAGSSTGSTGDEASSSSGTTDPSQPRSSRQGGSNSSTTNTVSTSSSSDTTLILGLSGGGAVILGLIGLLGCAAKRRRTRNADLDAKFSSLDTPKASTSHESTIASTHSYLDNDVRNDKALIPFRIEQSDLPLGEQIAQRNSSAVYKATFQDQVVAVKQLSPGAWENKVELSQFMDEIRMCASLDHPKIVAFVGIAWSSVRDLSVVMEFMPLGDLHTLLLRQQDAPRPQDWSCPWAPSQIKSKTSIAQNVAEAVVYLHSFNSPIIHRNLKARNVLLDSEGNAKLSGFGISRSSSADDTMTGEIGTVAWVAPEILRGERYDEKADIYSLGVLMVELDRCQHPYASEAALGVAPGQRGVQQIANKNTQIAILVSSGKLRPKISSGCPESIASIVDSCLSFDAASRPTSMEIFYRLRRARNVE